MWLCVYVRRGMASRTRSSAAGASEPSGCRPNITVPISILRTPPASYRATASASPGYSSGRDMRQKSPGVQVHGVSADRGEHGHSRLHQRLAEVPGRSDPVPQVVVVDDLAQPLCERFEVATGQAAVRREPLGEDQYVAALPGQLVVIHRQPSTDVAHRVLLG